MNFRVERLTVVALATLALLLFVTVPHLHADDRANCQHAIEKAEARLDKAIHDHGDHSREADQRRHDLNVERQHCWDRFHEWWNGKEHRWEKERWQEDHR